MSKKQLLLLSSSSVHGYEYLQYAADDIRQFLQRNRVSRLLFIPYALHDYDAYHKKISHVFKMWDIPVDSVHHFKVPEVAVENAEAIFIGGGNTFLLLKQLYEQKLINPIRERVLGGLPYIGTSAGTNVATVNICTTNDMPIVHPPSFDALNLVPFNINPHFLDSKELETHRGETREERILQYIEVTQAPAVLGMREGSTLLVDDTSATLRGFNKARLYTKDGEARELDVGSDLSFLLDVREAKNK